MSNILVTGGAGFIGSHLATAFVEAGHSVRVLDNCSTGHAENLSHLAGRFEWTEGDIRDAATCRAACGDIDFVFHQAALGSVPKSVDEPQPSHDTNIGGTFNILRAAVDCGVRRVIYAASSSAYGDSEVSPKHEGITPNPLSPYAVQKLCGEQYCRSFSLCYGLETLSLRYFNVFGERQDPHGAYAAAIPAFVAAILRGDQPVVYGDGEQTRDFTYIKNVVDGNFLAMEVAKTSGEAMNLACGGQISINQVLAAINKSLGTNVAANYVAPRTGDILHSCADVSMAREFLGFEPSVGFEEGLDRAIEYYRSLASV